jgi:outer membrane protein OmpA-like peptidoglycan-associated protein
MVGLIFLDDYRSMVEYIQIELVKPLVKDHYYCLSFYVASSNLNPIVTNKVGAYFSKEVLKTPIWEPLIKYPQVKTEAIIEANGKWVKIEGTFKANGGEQFMTIGNFFEAYYLKEEQTFVNTNQVFTYYYYDNFTLFKSDQFCNSEENMPPIKRKEELEHLVYFDSDKYQLSLAELERLSSFIYRLEEDRFKQLKIEAHTDTLGSVFYNMILAQQRANSVRQIIDSISNLESYSIWYGEDKPLQESITNKDTYNAKSRRVKIIAVE